MSAVRCLLFFKRE